MSEILYVHVAMLKSNRVRDEDKWFATMEDAIKWYHEK